MKINTMILQNFQAIKYLKFDFNGKNSEIRGVNASGKSTLSNAFSWLLCDKSNSYEKDYNPYSLNQDISDCSVEVKFNIITLKKIKRKNFIKKRGQTNTIFNGYITEYFIDGVPKLAKEFENIIENIIEKEKILILINPFYFSEILHWTKSRAILLSLINDISDIEIIQNNKELEPLNTLLLKKGEKKEYYNIDDFKKMQFSELKKLNGLIGTCQFKGELPIRIDEAGKEYIIELYQGTLEQLEFSLKNKKIELDKFKNDKNNLLNTSNSLEILQQISKKETEIINTKNEYNALNYANNSKIRGKILEFEDINISNNIKIALLLNNITNLNIKLKEKQKLREKITNEYNALNNLKFDESAENCNACNQKLPIDKIEEIKKGFNIKKSDDLENIKKFNLDNCSKAIIEQILNDIKISENKKNILLDKNIILEKKISELKNQIQEILIFEKTEQFLTLEIELNILKNTKFDEINTSEIDEKIQNLEKQINNLIIVKNNIIQNEKTKLRIIELETELEIVRQNQEIAQYNINLCELFIKIKCNLLSENINNIFDGLKIELFETQINGGIIECCNICVPNNLNIYVPFNASLNTGSKIKAGISIINTLSKKWDIELPLFIDNYESITDEIDFNGQIIKLIADKNYTELTLI